MTELLAEGLLCGPAGCAEAVAVSALDNATLTPHLGFVTEDNMRRFHAGAALAVTAYLDGTPTNILRPQAPEGTRSI